MSHIYHVAKTGCDRNPGTQERPFLTIQRAADIAAAGDTVIVHEGVYREWVKPRRGGLSADLRITYLAAEGEKAMIKGSERAEHWERVEGDVWKTEIDRSIYILRMIRCQLYLVTDEFLRFPFSFESRSAQPPLFFKVFCILCQ